MRKTPAGEQHARRLQALEIELAIKRMFLAVDVIDAHIETPPRHAFPFRGIVPCPNCDGRLTYVQLTPVKGAARCSGTCGVDFAPNREVTGAEMLEANRRLGLSSKS